MRKAHLRKKKRISFLLILTFGMILGGININQFFFSSNTTLTDEIKEDLDWMDETLQISYSTSHSDSGSDIDVIFHQSYLNNSYNTYLSNLSNSDLFTIPSPTETTFNSSYMEMEVTDIYAPNKTIIVEDYAGVAWQDADDVYASFEVQGVGYIENISFYMIHTAGINPWSLVDIYLFEAEDDLSNLRPKDSSGTLIYSNLNVSNAADWYTAINIHESFNASAPENKTYFLYTDVSGTGTCNWRYSFDSDGQDYDDESIVLNSAENEIQYLATSVMDTIDLSLKVGVSPLNNTPKPQDINLTINNNAVVNSTKYYSNEGIITTWNKEYVDSDGNLELEVKADWWDVSCNITEVQINYTKTDIKASSQFIIPGSGQDIFWNATIEENVNWFDTRLDKSYINFTIPTQWNDFSIFNGEDNQTITWVPSNSKTVTAHEAGNGTHWYLNATSSNLLDDILYSVNGELITDNRVNCTNILLFNASFNTFIGQDNGEINVTVFSPDPFKLINFTVENNSFNSGTNIKLVSWDINGSISTYGEYTVQLHWSNDTDAGFREEELTIMRETDLDVTFPATTFNSSQTFNITVYYNDTGKNQAISGNTIQYQIESGSWRNDSIVLVGNGSYLIEINCNDTDFGGLKPSGPKSIKINASKEYSYNHSETVEILILRETELTLLDRTEAASYAYDSGDTFNITVQFNDTFESEGIQNNVLINYSIDGNDYRHDNVFYWENGKYNITIDCSDDHFGIDYGDLKNIIVNASRHYYYNQSVNFYVNVTGETCLNYFYDTKPFYYSNETFYIITTYNDTVRNTNIDPFGSATDFLINGSSALVGPTIDGISPGIWNITINCSFHQEFQDGNYGYYNLTFVGERTNYYISYNYTIIFIKGSTSLDLLSPAENLNYIDGVIFNIIVQYNDTVKGEGIAGADIGISFNGTYWFNNENVTDNGNGRYTIEIYTNDLRMNYGWETILINASKQNYTEGDTSFTFEKRIRTTISPSNFEDLGSITRGEIVYYLFDYDDTDGNPIPGAIWETINGTYNFIIGMNEYDTGRYNISLNSINVDVAGSPYTYVFNMSALGNQTQIISLTINVTNIGTEVIIYSNNQTLIRKEGYNQTVSLFFRDTNNDRGINNTITSDVVVRDNSTGSFSIRNGGVGDHNWTLYEIGGGYYMLNISIKGLDSGWIRFQINLSQLPNYNYGVAYINFYIIGNSSQVNIQTMHDIDGKLIPEGSNKNYTWIINRQIIINFTVVDTDYSTNLAIGQTTWHSAMWFDYNNPYINGSLTITPSPLDYHGTTRSHQGTMQTDSLALGRYIINITIKIPNYEAVTFSFNLTIRAVIQTYITIDTFNGTLIQREGYNQTIWLTFNSTEDDSPIGGASTSDIYVFDNSTGSFQVRDIWTLYEDSGTTGLYKLNVSINGLISGYIRLRINMSFLPDYDWSIQYITFYLTGNSTRISVISWSDEDGAIITPESGNYTWFDDRNVNVTFSIQDINNGYNDVSGNIDIISVSWYKYSDASSGTLTISYGSYDTTRYSLLTINPLSLGSYIINFTVKIKNYESTMASYNLTIREKYPLNLTSINLEPAEITAGDQFTISFIVVYDNDTHWLPLNNTQIRLHIYVNGESISISTDWETTASDGSISFSLTAVSGMSLVLEIEEGYFYDHIGMEITNISVSPFVGGGIDPAQLMMWLIIIGAAVGAAAGSIGIYKGVVVPKKREKARVLSEVKTIFDDAVSLEHILVLYKNSGMCIFFKSFGLEEIDPEMISGFLSAVSTFGKEMESQKMLNEITYGDKVLLLSDGEYVRVALVLGKKPSIPIRKNLKEFIAAFESSYANILPTWRGNLKAYQDAGAIVDEILNTSIILPHEIKYSSKAVKSLKKPNSKEILKIAQNLVADSERQYFFIGQLLTLATDKLDKDLAEIFMGIKELRDNKLLIPIEISAIEEKPISEQELNLIRQKVSQLTHLAPEVTEKLVNDIASIASPAEREAFLVSLGEHQTIVSAPVKGGAAVIDSAKSAKKEIKGLLNKASKAEKQDEFTKALEIYHNAAVLASNYELTKLTDEINDLIRKATIHESTHKLHNYEAKAKKAEKTAKYKEAARLYQLASDTASQIFKLGRTDMTKEVKRLTNKSRECERLAE